MCTFTASATEPLKYLTNQGRLPFAAIHFSTPTSRNHIGGAKRLFEKGNHKFGMAAPRNDGPSEWRTGTATSLSTQTRV